MILKIVLIALMLSSSAAFAADYSDNAYAVAGSKTIYFANPDPTPDFSSLLASWKTSPNLSIDAALATLPRTMRMNYVLMYNSGSIQQASFESPRAILHSPSADLVVSFNGDESQVGGNTIEAMAYNRSKEKYDFYEVTFSGGKIHSEINPSKCIACHTSALIPNWRQYNNWTGAYGEHGDGFQFLVKTYENFKGGFLTENSQPTESASVVLDHFKDFVRSQSQRDRYRQLVVPENEPFWPFYKYLESGSEAYDYSPNRRLGIGLTMHMARSIGARLEKSRLFRDYPAALTSTLLRCNPDPRLQRRILNLIKEKLLFETASAIQSHAEKYNYYELALSQLLAVTGVMPDYWRADLSDRMQRLQDTRAEEDTIGFEEMSRPSTMVGTYLYQKLKSLHPEWRAVKDGASEKMSVNMGATVRLLQDLDNVIPLYSEKVIEGDVCKDLAPVADLEYRRDKKIGFELTGADWNEVRRSQSGIPYVLNQCSQCHAQGSYETAPYIPFDKPAQLRTALRNGSSGLLNEIRFRTNPNALDSVRMPHGPIGLLPEKREELIRYLEHLAN